MTLKSIITCRVRLDERLFEQLSFGAIGLLGYLTTNTESGTLVGYVLDASTESPEEIKGYLKELQMKGCLEIEEVL